MDSPTNPLEGKLRALVDEWGWPDERHDYLEMAHAAAAIGREFGRDEGLEEAASLVERVAGSTVEQRTNPIRYVDELADAIRARTAAAKGGG